eukprot:10507704-Heterocapsa_arctica.AAC.1
METKGCMPERADQKIRMAQEWMDKQHSAADRSSEFTKNDEGQPDKFCDNVYDAVLDVRLNVDQKNVLEPDKQGGR